MSSAGLVATAALTSEPKFFKRFLGNRIRFGMIRSWHDLPPLMALEQSIDRTFVYFMSYTLFKRVSDRLGGHDFALCSTVDKRRKKGHFLVQGEILVASSAWPDGFDTLWAKSFIQGRNFRDKWT